MIVLYLIIFFLFGLFMGSFYTVVGSRFPKNENFIMSRSYCDHCHHKLSFFDMIPVLSFFLLKGRCRYCNAEIDNLSSCMEIFTGILYSLAFYTFGFSYELLIALGIISMLIIISVSDISYLIIPDELLIFFTGYFLIINLLNVGAMKTLYCLLSGILLFCVMYAIMMFGNFLFKKECLGGGDIKMMFVFGLVLHPLLGVITIFIGSLLALPISLFILFKKRQNLVPFGPFLLISLAFVYFTKIDVGSIIDFVRLL